MAADKVDAAIAATQAKEPPKLVEVNVITYTLTLSTGKPASVGVPEDATAKDWLDLIGIIMGQVLPAHVQMIQQRSPMSRLALPMPPSLVLP